MRITKMHGAGNDFVIVDNRAAAFPTDRLPALARLLCAFHTGVGADGLMVVVPAKSVGDYGMLFYNADGSLGEMCGNGARCICRYGHDHGLAAHFVFDEAGKPRNISGVSRAEEIIPRTHRSPARVVLAFGKALAGYAFKIAFNHRVPAPAEALRKGRPVPVYAYHVISPL